MHVGIDWGMDGFSVGNGQFRYAVDLINALAALGAAAQVTVFGTRPEPPATIVKCFAGGSNWEWVAKPLARGRGSFWVDQWRSFRAHRGRGLEVLHVIDATPPYSPPCPVVVTVHDLMAEVFPQDYAEWITGRGYRRWRWLLRHRAQRLLAISRTTAADVQRLWRVPARRIDTVYHGTAGFPPAGFEASWSATLTSRFPTLVGRRFVLAPYNLEPRKNLPALLAAFRTVRAQFPDVELVLFGKGSWTPEREERTSGLLAKLDLAGAATRTGIVSDTELAALYRAADVFAFPPLYEGFGLPLLEAMACGACVLARNASAMAEVVGDAGLLVETADPTALADGLTQLLSNGAERDRLRAAARARAATFTPVRMAAETFAVYRKAAAR
ncbi:glycosyltransferase family 4 protein [Gemmata sp.]|uniref:glycosyltransferase family 4 protein n=1 Tax=Gemmata sp. TaxID=1914242 RepID=UPI003F705233